MADIEVVPAHPGGPRVVISERVIVSEGLKEEEPTEVTALDENGVILDTIPESLAEEVWSEEGIDVTDHGIEVED